LPRKKRPLDRDLFGESLVQDENYAELLRYILKEEGCWMSHLRDMFSGKSQGSMVYYRVERLERGKLIKIRSDGTENWLEVTPRGEELLKEYA
jgi:predicted transcriptional regulator